MQSLTPNHFQPNGFLLHSPKPSPPPQFPQTLHLHPKLPSPPHSLQSPHPLHPLLKTTTHNLTVLLVGGMIFLGSFGCKPSLAVAREEMKHTQGGSIGENCEDSEEIKHTQGGNIGENCEDREVGMYVRMLERNPRDVEALKAVTSMLMTKGKTREAVRFVERLIEVEPEEVEWRLLQALTYETMGALSKAKRLFREILEERPLLLRALHGLAMVMHKNKEGRAVFEMLNEALELAKREKRVTEERNIRILIAQMHVVKGELRVGLKKFSKLIEENPRDFRPYLCQGIIYTLLNQKKEADEQFATYRSLVPEEFPDRGFLDDVVLAAKTEPREKIEEELEAEFSYKK